MTRAPSRLWRWGLFHHQIRVNGLRHCILEQFRTRCDVTHAEAPPLAGAARPLIRSDLVQSIELLGKLLAMGPFLDLGVHVNASECWGERTEFGGQAPGRRPR